MPEENPAYQGPLLFVNHDSRNRDPISQQHNIRKHIQGSYASWKRGNRSISQRMRPSKLAISASVLSRTRSAIVDDGHETSTENDDSDEQLLFPVTVSRSTRDEFTLRRSSLFRIGPSTMLREGNSDPFNVFAVPIDARVNALMAFTRDYYLQGLHAGDINNPGTNASLPEWVEYVSFLHDEGLAYSHFAQMATLVTYDSNFARDGADYKTQSLVFKVKSIASLRKRLAEATQDHRTPRQVLMLLTAELHDQDHLAASFYAKVLALLLQNNNPTADYSFLLKVLYIDVQRASMSLSRPSFDVDEWAPKRFATYFDPIIRRLPRQIFNNAAQNVDHALELDDALREILILCEYGGMLYYLSVTDKSYLNMYTIFYQYIRYLGLVAMARLINRYLDAEALLAESDNGISFSSAWVQVFTSLAALLLGRCTARVDNVHITANISVFEANTLIMRKLRQLLHEQAWTSPPEEQYRHANLRLWALYTGAWVEQVQARFSRSVVESGWFNMQLAEQARGMRLYEWPDVEVVLRGIYYSENLQPNGSQWFARIMSSRNDAVSCLRENLERIGVEG